MNVWGVPHWTDADAYPSADGLTNLQWWWEFTRRRPDYREAWQVWSADESRVCSDGGIRYAMADPDETRRQFSMSFILDPSLTLDHHDIWQLRTPAHGVGIHHNPSGDLQLGAFYERGGSNALDAEIKRRKDNAAADEALGLYDYRFNLAEPLKTQIQKAQQHLQAIQNERFGTVNTRKPRRMNWPLFLRALDARDAGATYEVMAQTFWPKLYHATGSERKTAQSARDTYEAACQLRNNFPV